MKKKRRNSKLFLKTIAFLAFSKRHSLLKRLRGGATDAAVGGATDAAVVGATDGATVDIVDRSKMKLWHQWEISLTTTTTRGGFHWRWKRFCWRKGFCWRKKKRFPRWRKEFPWRCRGFLWSRKGFHWQCQGFLWSRKGFHRRCQGFLWSRKGFPWRFHWWRANDSLYDAMTLRISSTRQNTFSMIHSRANRELQKLQYGSGEWEYGSGEWEYGSGKCGKKIK